MAIFAKTVLLFLGWGLSFTSIKTIRGGYLVIHITNHKPMFDVRLKKEKFFLRRLVIARFTWLLKIELYLEAKKLNPIGFSLEINNAQASALPVFKITIFNEVS